MIPVSQKETNQREKDLYYAVLSFLKSVRKAGKTTAKEWNEYRSKLTGIAPSPEMSMATDMWTMYMNYFIGNEYGKDYWQHPDQQADLSLKKRSIG